MYLKKKLKHAVIILIRMVSTRDILSKTQARDTLEWGHTTFVGENVYPMQLYFKQFIKSSITTVHKNKKKRRYPS